MVLPSARRFSPRNCRVDNNQYEQRREAIAGGLSGRKLDCLLVAFSPNLRYLSGFTGSNGALLIFARPQHSIHGPALPDSGAAGVQLQDPYRQRAAGGGPAGGA